MLLLHWTLQPAKQWFLQTKNPRACLRHTCLAATDGSQAALYSICQFKGCQFVQMTPQPEPAPHQIQAGGQERFLPLNASPCAVLLLHHACVSAGAVGGLALQGHAPGMPPPAGYPLSFPSCSPAGPDSILTCSALLPSQLQPCQAFCITPLNALSLVVCRGRRRAGLLYVATYTFGCLTKHWNNFGVLLVGRIFCGVATSLLYSAFESWLVAEHFKVGRRNWVHSQHDAVSWYVLSPDWCPHCGDCLGATFRNAALLP